MSIAALIEEVISIYNFEAKHNHIEVVKKTKYMNSQNLAIRADLVALILENILCRAVKLAQIKSQVTISN